MVAKPDPKEVGPAYMTASQRRNWRHSLCNWWYTSQCVGDIGRYRAFHNGSVTVACDYHAAARRGRIRAVKARKAKRLAAMKEPLTANPRLEHRHYFWVDDGKWR